MSCSTQLSFKVIRKNFADGIYCVSKKTHNDGQDIFIGERGCHQFTCAFLVVWENLKVYVVPKSEHSMITSEFPVLSKFPMELGFPRILKLQKTEHEIRVVTKYVISKCNILFQIFVQKDFESRSKSFRLTWLFLENPNISRNHLEI